MCYVRHSTKKYGALAWLFALLTLASTLIACSGSPTDSPTPSTSKPSIPKVTLIARDRSLDMPTTLHAGFVDVTMVNEGTQTQPAQFARLKQAATLEQLQAAVQKERHAILPLIIPAGGMLAVKPERSQEMILDLPPGQYVVLNFIPGDDTLPHTGKALVTSFTVIGPSIAGTIAKFVA